MYDAENLLLNEFIMWHQYKWIQRVAAEWLCLIVFLTMLFILNHTCTIYFGYYYTLMIIMNIIILFLSGRYQLSGLIMDFVILVCINVCHCSSHDSKCLFLSVVGTKMMSTLTNQVENWELSPVSFLSLWICSLNPINCIRLRS